MSKSPCFGMDVPTFLAVLAAFTLSVRLILPIGTTGLSVSPSDFLIPFAIIFFLFIRRSLLPARDEFHVRGFLWSLTAMTVVIVSGSAIGYFNSAHIIPWALYNRCLGWVVVLAYLYVSVRLIYIMPDFAFLFCKVMAIMHAALVFIFLVFQAAVFVFRSHWLVSTLKILSNENNLAQFSGMVGNPNFEAFLLLVGFCSALYSSEGGRIIRVIILALILVGLWVSGSRAGLVAALVACLPLISVPRKTIALGVAVTLAIGYGVMQSYLLAAGSHIEGHYLSADSANEQKFLNLSEALSRADKEDEQIMGILDGGEEIVSHSPDEYRKTGGSDTLRIDMFHKVLEAWRTSPLFGIGIGVFLDRKMLVDYSGPVLIHGIPLWLLAETGILGFGVFVFSFCWIFWSVWERYKIDKEVSELLSSQRLTSLAFLLSFAAMGLFHDILYQRVFWVMLGFAVSTYVSRSRYSPSQRQI